jgi:hypothetical protein
VLHRCCKSESAVICGTRKLTVFLYGIPTHEQRLAAKSLHRNRVNPSLFCEFGTSELISPASKYSDVSDGALEGPHKSSRGPHGAPRNSSFVCRS